MKLQIIETPDYILAVSDEEIKEGDIIYANGGLWNGTITHCTEIPVTECWVKIIAYQPKGNAPELDLPLLPEMVVEDDVEKLAEEYVTDESYLPIYKEECKRAYINGNKAVTKRFSENDLRKMFAYGHQIGMNTTLQILSPNLLEKQDINKLRDEFLQSLKQPKWFVAEMRETKSEVFRENDNAPYAVLKTTTINDKEYLEGTYIWE